MISSKKFRLMFIVTGLLLLLTIVGYSIWDNLLVKQRNKTELTHFESNHKEEEIVSVIEQSKLFLDMSKEIDSLSSGTRGLTMTLALSDSAKNIYLVKVSEDNGGNFVTYFNFLVDANKMKILNPTGKLEGQ
jgi:hypothetical protein